ncbi:MAG: hypothetical protein RIT42_1314, partial [Bacteroidota bacterium]
GGTIGKHETATLVVEQPLNFLVLFEQPESQAIGFQMVFL